MVAHAYRNLDSGCAQPVDHGLGQSVILLPSDQMRQVAEVDQVARQRTHRKDLVSRPFERLDVAGIPPVVGENVGVGNENSQILVEAICRSDSRPRNTCCRRSDQETASVQNFHRHRPFTPPHSMSMNDCGGIFS